MCNQKIINNLFIYINNFFIHMYNVIFYIKITECSFRCRLFGSIKMDFF